MKPSSIKTLPISEIETEFPDFMGYIWEVRNELDMGDLTNLDNVINDLKVRLDTDDPDDPEGNEENKKFIEALEKLSNEEVIFIDTSRPE